MPSLRDLFAATGSPLPTIINHTPPPRDKRPPLTPASASATARHSAPFWAAVAVVLWQHSWRCRHCNTIGISEPHVMLREEHGRGENRKVRLRAVGNPALFALLPRITELGEPAIVPACPTCFLAGDTHPQQTLPDFEPPPADYHYTPREKLYNSYAASRDVALAARTFKPTTSL